MRSSKDRQLGLTLVEVMIAVVILTVGVLAAAGMQTSGLQATRVAKAVQELNSAASTEMDVWRGSYLSSTTPETRVCLTTDSSCEVEVLPCALSAGTMDCTRKSVPAPVAHIVTVRISHQVGRDLELTSLVRMETP